MDAIKARQAIAILGILGSAPVAFGVIVREDGQAVVVRGGDTFDGVDLVDALAQLAQTVEFTRAVPS